MKIKRLIGYTVIDTKRKMFFDYDCRETKEYPEIYNTKRKAQKFLKDIGKELLFDEKHGGTKVSHRFKKDFQIVKLYYSTYRL